MTTYLSDSFTEASDTALASHSPETGGTWAKNPGFSASATVASASGKLTGASTSAAVYYNDVTPASADYDVKALLRISSAGEANLTIRQSTSVGDFYQCRLSVSGLAMLRIVNGSGQATFALYSFTPVVGQDYEVVVRARGSKFDLFLDGQWVSTGTDSTITAAGKPGVRLSSTGFVDDIEAADAVTIGDIVVQDGIWTWFSDPRAVYDGTAAYYIGSVTSDGSTKISKYLVSDGSVSEFVLSAALQKDDHNNVAPLILPSGKIACFYSQHNDASGSRYRISSSAGDISAFDAEETLGDSVENTAYSNPFYLSDASKVVLCYRQRATSNPTTWGFRSAPSDLSSWDAEVKAWKGADDSYTPYFKFAQNGNGRIDVLCTDRPPSNDTGFASIYHFHMQWDAGTSAFKFYQSGGTEITAATPWRVNEEASLVYDGTTASEDSWIWQIAIDDSGHPRVLFTRLPSTTDHRYYFTRWNGSAWTTPVQIAAAGQYLYASEPYYSGGICFDGNDVDRVYASIESGGEFEISEWITSDDGATWSKNTDITTDSTTTYKNARPYSPNGHEASIGCLYWRANYPSFTAYLLPAIKAFENDTASGSASVELEAEPGALAIAGAAASLGVLVQLLVRDEQGNLVTDEEGIEFEWYDDPDSTSGEPTDSGTIATDANGLASITLPNSAKLDTELGGLILRHPVTQGIRGYYAAAVEVP